LGRDFRQDRVRECGELPYFKGFQKIVLAALLKAVAVTVISGHQDYPAPALAGEPSKGKTVLRPRLANVNDYDVIVVIVERNAHFAASPERRE
jgi:hypothetical protein